VVGIVDGNTKGYIVSPNPNNGKFFLDVLKNEDMQVQVVNPLGQVVFKKHIVAQGRYQIDLGNIAAGVYTLQLYTSGQVVPIKVIIEP
jgi:hypothetical protein